MAGPKGMSDAVGAFLVLGICILIFALAYTPLAGRLRRPSDDHRAD